MLAICSMSAMNDRSHEMNSISCFIRYKYYRSEKLDIIISSETRNLK